MRTIYLLAVCSLMLLNARTFAGNSLPGDTLPQRIGSGSRKAEKVSTNVSIGAGLMSSVVYLSRNVKENNDALGYSGHIIIDATDYFRFSGQYTYYRTINIEPTWRNINAQSIEANMEFLARFKNNKSILYPFWGFSYNTFKGFFTGQNDFLGLHEFYTANSTVNNRWWGLNVGTGFEHSFGPVAIYLDYRMRIGQSDKGLNIMDVCYGAGLRVHIPKAKLRKVFRGPNDRFHWF